MVEIKPFMCRFIGNHQHQFFKFTSCIESYLLLKFTWFFHINGKDTQGSSEFSYLSGAFRHCCSSCFYVSYILHLLKLSFLLKCQYDQILSIRVGLLFTPNFNNIGWNDNFPSLIFKSIFNFSKFLRK